MRKWFETTRILQSCSTFLSKMPDVVTMEPPKDIGVIVALDMKDHAIFRTIVAVIATGNYVMIRGTLPIQTITDPLLTFLAGAALFFKA